MQHIPTTLLLTAALLTAVVPAGRAADEGDALKVLETHADNVVGVSAVLKIQMSGMGASRAQEQKIEGLGTVIDPSGLTVVSYSAIDPTSMMRNLQVMVGGQRQKLDAKTDFSDVKIRLADGTERPAKLVLKDPELDLAFIQPEAVEGADPYSYVDLKQAGKASLMDTVVSLGRLGKNLDRSSTIELHRIGAEVQKPRKFYVVSNAPGLGLPVFLLDGKVLGICLLRSQDASSGASLGQGGMQVILPAEDVLEIAAQALEEAE